LKPSPRPIVVTEIPSFTSEAPSRPSSSGELVTFFGWLGEGCPSGYRPPGAALQIPESFGLKTLVSPPMLEAAHSLGLEVHVWTVNESADMERLLDWGVDGIMSDWPEVLAEAGRKHIR
jgi:glycerophosphoryl diester phosphodiesterase